MAQKVITILEDDVDGTAADETVRFALDGVDYEIDLRAENSTKLRSELAPWIDAGRRLGGRRRANGGDRGARTDPAQLAAMRQWGRRNGFEVSDRGRVSREVQEAFHAATR